MVEGEEVFIQEILQLDFQNAVYEAITRDLIEKIHTIAAFHRTALQLISSIRKCVVRIVGKLSGEKNAMMNWGWRLPSSSEDMTALMVEMSDVYDRAIMLEAKVMEFLEMTREEKEELLNRIVSLIQELKDASTLLRSSFAENAVMKRILKKLSEGGEQNNKAGFLQIAGRGLRWVGSQLLPGTMIPDSEPAFLISNLDASESDENEGSEQPTSSLISTVENIMKNLRCEISDLKQSLDKSRIDRKRLQSLADAHAQKVEETTSCMKDLQERNDVLAKNLEELLSEMKKIDEEAAKWRKACELEVQAGRAAVNERNLEVSVLKEELVRMQEVLDASTAKQALKEKLAAAAMVAEEAAEASLCLADTRLAALRKHIEELTRLLNEEDGHGREQPSGGGFKRRKVRRLCWPWGANYSSIGTSFPVALVARNMK